MDEVRRWSVFFW